MDFAARYKNSIALTAATRAVSPGGAQTMSKQPARFVEGAYPAYLVRGSGARVWDVDGHEYIDWLCGLGAVPLGYDHPEVTDSIRAQLDRGLISPSLPTELEEAVAAKLVKVVPCARDRGQVRFVKTGSEACAAAVRIARRATGRDTVIVCYDAETELLTEEGFRLVSAVRVGDRIATLNPQTHALEYQRVERSIAYQHAGTMIHVDSKRVDLMVTPEHQVYRRFKTRSGMSWRVVEARTLVGRAVTDMLAGVASWSGPEPIEIELPSARAVQESGKRSRGRVSRGHPTKGIVRYDAVRLFRFLGHYLSEGWVFKSPRRPGYVIQIRQAPGASKDSIVDNIRAMGFRVRVAGDLIEFHSKELWTALQDFGMGAVGKCIPAWVKSHGPALLRPLLEGLLDGDGSRGADGTARRYYTISPQLADDVCEVALKVGLTACATWREPCGFGKQRICHISLSQEPIRTIARDDVHEVPYNGMVYCVTVPNHLVLARRNGRAVWSGNCGYHGWHDWVMQTADPHPGIPNTFLGNGKLATIRVPYNDLWAISKVTAQTPTAAVMLEPMLLEPPEPGYLQAVVTFCRDHGIVSIFDEMVTGFRWATAGGQEYFGVTPDLAVFGKGLANGMPLACIVGPERLMKYADVISGTFGGECLSLAAASAVLDVYDAARDSLAHPCSNQWRRGAWFLDTCNNLGIPTTGVGVHPKITFAPDVMPIFLQETALRGLLLHPAGFNVSAALTLEDLQLTREALAGAMDAIKEGATLHGARPSAGAFARTT